MGNPSGLMLYLITLVGQAHGNQLSVEVLHTLKVVHKLEAMTNGDVRTPHLTNEYIVKVMKTVTPRSVIAVMANEDYRDYGEFGDLRGPVASWAGITMPEAVGYRAFVDGLESNNFDVGRNCALTLATQLKRGRFKDHLSQIATAITQYHRRIPTVSIRSKLDIWTMDGTPQSATSISEIIVLGSQEHRAMALQCLKKIHSKAARAAGLRQLDLLSKEIESSRRALGQENN